MDQLTLSSSVGIDRVSGSDVIRRLVRRGFLERNPSEVDRRAKLIKITKSGKGFVNEIRPLMIKTQSKLIEPLTEKEQEEFLRMLKKLIDANNDASRAPLSSP